MKDTSFAEAPVPPLEAAERFVRGPAPSWVEPVEAPPASESNGATSWLLLDEQCDLRGPEAEYTRQVYRAHNATGVDSLSEIRLRFNPTYQTLTLHGVSVLRDGQVIDALEDADIDFMRVEHDMYARVYRGDYEVVIQARGLEPGDVVDYGYTIEGSNPVFGGRAVWRIFNSYSAHLGRRFLRILLPKDRTLDFHQTGPEQELETITHKTHVEHRLDQRDIERHEFESFVPSEFGAQASSFVISGFRSWRDVADWSAQLYETADDEPFVSALADRCRNQQEMPPEQAAIAYVQEGIRYVAMSYGEGGYRPRPLEVLAKRRYGDCKDKSRLLAALLRKLGHEAAPALVNMYRPKGPFADHPSPGSFNHVIVKAKIRGEEFWIDATASGQRGPLALRERPYAMAALLIRPGVTELETIPDLTPNLFGDWSEGVCDLSRGPGSPVVSEDELRCVGKDAESLRRSILGQGIDGLRRDFEEAASQDFGHVEYERFDITDDEQTNTITMHTRMLLHDPWRPGPDGSQTFRSTICYATTLLPAIGVGERQLPLALLEHPLHHKHIVHYMLPAQGRPAGLRTARQARRNSGFEFTRTDTLLEHELLVDVETRTLAHYIPAEEALAALRDQTTLQRGHVLELTFGEAED